MPALKPPEFRNARLTLGAIAVLLYRRGIVVTSFPYETGG